MSDIAIRVEGLGKRYSLRHQVRQEGLRHVLQDAVTSLWKPRKRAAPAADAPAAREDFWALRDVSFEVKRGEVVGIIGRNGAGKSTLLKILSRITEPTTGSIEIEGRVASLLEVGTGFHPELTGRENVYLNGAILGMSRAEIRKKFDEIVAFAEVEKFLDTPVKHYSSGMYVRLAFAVAAHLEPEILIVDEVLAVGDAQFQKKCLGKMQDVSQREGRTIIFVSHNMDAVTRLCSELVLLQNGAVLQRGDPARVISQYLSSAREIRSEVQLSARPREGGDVLHRRASFDRAHSPPGAGAWLFAFGDPIVLHFTIETERKFSNLDFLYAVYTALGFEIASARCRINRSSELLPAGSHAIEVRIPHLRLVPGIYHLNLGLQSEYGAEDFIAEAILFEVSNNRGSAELQADQIRATCIPETVLHLQTTS